MDLSTQRLMMGAAGSAAPTYVEGVFSTWLYTGNGSTQTITNGIDLSGEGGLVWIKRRDSATNHVLCDTNRGITKVLNSNSTSGDFTSAQHISSTTSSGFTVGNDGDTNQSAGTFASWTFRKAAKFFDVVTWTGDGTSGLISHNHSLGSTPGCIIIKGVSGSSPWQVYHRSLGTDQYIQLNSTAAAGSSPSGWAVTSSTFSIESSIFGFNTSGQTYVAYLFAHDAGGFGDSGDDSVVKCGSYTGNGSTSGPTIDLGWEPQWVLTKPSSSTGAWTIHDNMRGFAVTGGAGLQPHLSNAEYSSNVIRPTSTGFQLFNTSSDFNGNGVTYIYIAIRRGPMKTPTDATKVFSVNATSGTNTTNFPVDMFLYAIRAGDAQNSFVASRLTGSNGMSTALTDAERADGWTGWDSNTTRGFLGGGHVEWDFRRAPGFFDVVAYTGDGDTSTTTVPHGLTVQPELMIFKNRSAAGGWDTYVPSNATNYYLVRLNNTGAQLVGNVLRTNASSSTLLKVGWLSGNVNGINDAGYTYIAYLFATCPGVSKVGSYTGTGTTLSIDCGFTNGSRFVLIKRTDSTGDWYVWDSARGIVAGNDPYLLLNSTAAEVTSTDYVDTYSAGFEISSTAPAAINANGGSFVFLAVA